MLFFELFPAFVMVVSGIIGVWLYASNRRAPDESADDERRRRESDERKAAAGALGAIKDPRTRRPSMRG